MPVMTRPRIEGIDNLVITTNGVRNLLMNLNPKKANRPDLLPIRVLKEAASETAPILQVIYSVSLQQGHAPHDWRSANIVPVYKKDDRHCPANYRPVSLTSVSCKLLEHIIYKHIMRHCETHNIIVDIQRGFRSGRSCESQLITAREEIAAWRDKGHNVDVLIMDFSKVLTKSLTSASYQSLSTMGPPVTFGIGYNTGLQPAHKPLSWKEWLRSL